MLGRVPPLPDRATYGLLERVPLESKWHITGSVDCQVNGEPAQVPPVYLSWLIEAPTKMTLGGTSFRTWHEFEDDDQPNFLAILVLAWSYILTARLVELQGQDGSRVHYTRSAAPVFADHKRVTSFSVMWTYGQCDGLQPSWLRGVVSGSLRFKKAALAIMLLGKRPW